MNTIRVDFKNDLGDQYVEMRTFKVVPWSLSREINAIPGLSGMKPGTSADEMTTEQMDAVLAMAETIAVNLVVGGHVLDAWSGEEMKFPLTRESVKDAPAEMLMAVFAKFGELKAEVDAATKKS